MTERCLLLAAPLVLESSDVHVLLPGLEAPAWMAALGPCLAYKKITNLCLPPEMILNTQAGSEIRTAYMLIELGALGNATAEQS